MSANILDILHFIDFPETWWNSCLGLDYERIQGFLNFSTFSPIFHFLMHDECMDLDVLCVCLVYHMQEDGWIKVCQEDVSELIHRYRKGMF